MLGYVIPILYLCSEAMQCYQDTICECQVQLRHGRMPDLFNASATVFGGILSYVEINLIIGYDLGATDHFYD